MIPGSFVWLMDGLKRECTQNMQSIFSLRRFPVLHVEKIRQFLCRCDPQGDQAQIVAVDA